MEVARRKEPPCPKPLASWADWVDAASLSDSSREPSLRDRIPVRRSDEEDEPPVFLELKDAPEVQEQWLRYLIDHWQPWAEEHRRWKMVHKVYGKLFAMHQQLQKLGEAYELVIGLGLLTWITASGQKVRHTNIKQLVERGGLSVLLVEQNVPVALRLAERVYVMRLGHIVVEETRDEMLHREHLWELF